MKKKYLILTASYGSGHNAARDAFRTVLERRGDEVRSIDMVDFLRHRGGGGSRKFYELSESVPILWDVMFRVLDYEFPNDFLNFFFNITTQKLFNEQVDEYRPDVILCVFPLWPRFVENYLKNKKRKNTFKVGVVVTDSIEIGTGWHVGQSVVDHYFVIDPHSREVMRKKFGCKLKNVHDTFFPIEERFFFDKEAIKSDTVVLLLTGMRSSFALRMIDALVQSDKVQKVLILQWRNQTLYRSLGKYVFGKKVELHDFLPLKEALRDIDIVISKPGWAILNECIANDVLLIAPHFTPGQEEGNIELMEREEVGVYEPSPANIIKIIEQEDLSRFLPRFHKLKNPHSIGDILKTLEGK